MDARRSMIGALFLGLLFALFLTPQPAQAAPMRWNTTKVCVESTVPAAWDIDTALVRWNALDPGPGFVQRADCSGFASKVFINLTSQGQYTGITTYASYDGDGSLRTVRIQLNYAYVQNNYPASTHDCVKVYTSTHELGHALGLDHYPNAYSGNAMSYQGWQGRCGQLGAQDRSDYRQLYGSSWTPQRRR